MNEETPLDDLAKFPSLWPLVEECLLSEQMPAERVHTLMLAHPKLARWLQERADQRQRSRGFA